MLPTLTRSWLRLPTWQSSITISLTPSRRGHIGFGNNTLCYVPFVTCLFRNSRTSLTFVQSASALCAKRYLYLSLDLLNEATNTHIWRMIQSSLFDSPFLHIGSLCYQIAMFIFPIFFFFLKLSATVQYFIWTSKRSCGKIQIKVRNQVHPKRQRSQRKRRRIRRSWTILAFQPIPTPPQMLLKVIRKMRKTK